MDHGFVVTRDENIKVPGFEIEDEVLFNPMNIFKVKDVIEPSKGV